MVVVVVVVGKGAAVRGEERAGTAPAGSSPPAPHPIFYGIRAEHPSIDRIMTES